MPLHSEANPQFITTIDDAWLVAIRSPSDGRLITRTLRPQTDENLRRAIRWRDRAYKKIFGKPVPTRIFHQTPKDTATGIPGVRFQIKKYPRKRGEPYLLPVIIAEIHTIPGKDYQRPRGAISRVFSLNKYDWDEAIALGTAWRIEQIKRLERKV